jgi:gas vesicle protein
MSSAKKFLYTMATGMAAGAILGILYAPADGAETRRRINKIKRRFGCGVKDDVNDERQTLEELSKVLQYELKRINKKLETPE